MQFYIAIFILYSRSLDFRLGFITASYTERQISSAVSIIILLKGGFRLSYEDFLNNPVRAEG